MNRMIPEKGLRSRALEAVYREGEASWEKHGESAYCPYPVGSGDRRTQWWTGYLDARTASRLPKIAHHQKEEQCRGR